MSEKYTFDFCYECGADTPHEDGMCISPYHPDPEPMWCPICKQDFEEDIEVCPECKVKLLDMRV